MACASVTAWRDIWVSLAKSMVNSRSHTARQYTRVGLPRQVTHRL
jgi:hypothetical protein